MTPCTSRSASARAVRYCGWYGARPDPVKPGLRADVIKIFTMIYFLLPRLPKRGEGIILNPGTHPNFKSAPSSRGATPSNNCPTNDLMRAAGGGQPGKKYSTGTT